MTVATLRPNSDESTGCLVNPSGSHYSTLNESTTNDSTYIISPNNGSWGEDRLGLPNHSSESVVISNVRLYTRIKNVNGLSNIAHYQIGLYVNSTAYRIASAYAPESWTNLYNDWTTNPNTSAAWSWSDIDNLQVLIKLESVFGSELYYYNNMCSQVRIRPSVPPSVLYTCSYSR